MAAQQMKSFWKRLLNKLHQIRLEQRDHQLQKVDPLSTILVSYPSNLGTKTKNKLCLYAHFDQAGKIADYVIGQCEELKKNGYDVILISTSPALEQNAIESALKSLRGIIHRKNLGYDFVSWRTAMMSLGDFSSYDELLLTNDSVFGPFSDLSLIFKNIADSQSSVSGLTDNWEKCYHLQSFFIHFKKPALHSSVFKSFWDTVRIRADKETIIISYEVGLSQHFIRHGYKLKALFPFHEIRAKCLDMGAGFQYRDKILRQPLNSTIFMWDVLLTEFGFPFIKTEILKINRFQSHNVPLWRSLIPAGFASIAERSEDYLKLGHENCRV